MVEHERNDLATGSRLSSDLETSFRGSEKTIKEGKISTLYFSGFNEI